MAEQPTEQDYIDRVIDRFRKDHDDPAIRSELIADGKLDDYVRAVLQDVTDETLLARVTSAVRAAEQG